MAAVRKSEPVAACCSRANCCFAGSGQDRVIRPESGHRLLEPCGIVLFRGQADDVEQHRLIVRPQFQNPIQQLHGVGIAGRRLLALRLHRPGIQGSADSHCRARRPSGNAPASQESCRACSRPGRENPQSGYCPAPAFVPSRSSGRRRRTPAGGPAKGPNQPSRPVLRVRSRWRGSDPFARVTSSPDWSAATPR